MNRIFVFGENDYGQLGIGTISKDKEAKLFEVKLKEKIKNVFVGRYTTIIQTKEFNYICGRVHYKKTEISSPTKFLNGIKVKKFSLGLGHILVLLENGLVLSYGENYNLQCGVENQKR